MLPDPMVELQWTAYQRLALAVLVTALRDLGNGPCDVCGWAACAHRFLMSDEADNIYAMTLRMPPDELRRHVRDFERRGGAARLRQVEVCERRGVCRNGDQTTNLLRTRISRS